MFKKFLLLIIPITAGTFFAEKGLSTDLTTSNAKDCPVQNDELEDPSSIWNNALDEISAEECDNENTSTENNFSSTYDLLIEKVKNTREFNYMASPATVLRH